MRQKIRYFTVQGTLHKAHVHNIYNITFITFKEEEKKNRINLDRSPFALTR